MGVPKFFRWYGVRQIGYGIDADTSRMSERYPAISQLIAENRIPEFDNLCKSNWKLEEIPSLKESV